MMSKTIMILGASIYQIDAILTAKRLGHRVITTDNRPRNPGHALADKSYSIDTTDVKAVLEIAKSECIDGIIAPCTDVAVTTAAAVSRELGLPGINESASSILTKKTLFRKHLVRLGLPFPQHYCVTQEDGLAALNTLHWQDGWILKPDDSSGSKGVFVVKCVEEIQTRLPDAFRFSKSGRAIVETFILGHQGTCEGVLQDGSVRFHVVMDRMTAPLPYVATTGHYVPSVLDERATGLLIDRIELVFQSLGVSSGPFDCDFVWTGGEIFLLEMTPRLGGNSISQLLRVATGFDLVEYAIRHALGGSALLPASLEVKPAAVVLLGVETSGYLEYDIKEVQLLAREPWIESIHLDFPRGSVVFPFIDGTKRLGEVYIREKDRDSLVARIKEFKARLAMRVVQAASCRVVV